MSPLQGFLHMLVGGRLHGCVQISESTTIAEKEKQKVVVIVDSVTKKAAEIASVKDDAERDLAAAKPALDAALAALNSISPKDITSLKALKNPPDVVKRIFDCVLLLRHWWVPGPAAFGGWLLLGQCVGCPCRCCVCSLSMLFVLCWEMDATQECLPTMAL